MAGKSSGKLKVTLPSDTELLLSRVFDAPRPLVWETMTKPEYVRRWWCCMDGYTMPVCEIDFRVGGTYRYLMVSADNECGFHGEYKEIVPVQKIVHTEIFDPFPDSPALCTLTLDERDGKTYYQTLVKHTSQLARDMHVQSGMEVGADIALDRIEEIALSLGAPRGAQTEPPRATR